MGQDDKLNILLPGYDGRLLSEYIQNYGGHGDHILLDILFWVILHTLTCQVCCHAVDLHTLQRDPVLIMLNILPGTITNSLVRN